MGGCGEVMRIEIIHRDKYEYQWDSFQVGLVDDSMPDGSKMRASASGDWKFVARIVADWVEEYRIKVL